MGENDSVGIYCYNDARSDYVRACRDADRAFNNIMLLRSLGYSEESGLILEQRVRMDNSLKRKVAARERMEELAATYKSAQLEHKRALEAGEISP